MKKTYLYVLPLALIMGAYSGQSLAQGTNSGESASGPPCKGDPKAPMINLNLNSMEVKPECALVHLGSTIVFRITPKKDLDSKMVEIEPKNPLDSWLTGDNSQIKDIIIIKVPGEHDPDKEEPRQFTDHDYSIKIDGVDHDPRIQVEH